MTKENYGEYFKTAFITMVILVVISAFVLLTERFRAESSIPEDDFAMQNDMIGYLITKYKNTEKENPRDASVNLKLGELYEMLESYNQAEDQYLIALEKRHNDYTEASFKLANVFLFKKQYDKAEIIIEGIKDAARYSVLRQKGMFYKSYGDALFNENKFSDALEQYTRSLSYLQKINSSNVKEVTRAQTESYVAMADYYVAQKQPKTAIELLEKALGNEQDPVVMYKLALLHLDDSPELSVDYLEKIMKKDSSIINFDIYKKLLFSLKMQMLYLGQSTKSELYDTKLSRLQSYMKRNVLRSDEIKMTDYSFKIKNYPIKNECDLIIDFDIRNMTTENIPKLSVLVEFYDEKGEKIHEYVEAVVTPNAELKPTTKHLDVTLVIRTKKNLIQQYKTVNMRIYLSKNPKVSSQLYVKQKFDVTKGKNSKKGYSKKK